MTQQKLPYKQTYIWHVAPITYLMQFKVHYPEGFW